MSEKIVIFDTGIASHVGLVRQVNEDSHFCRPGIGLWAVSDGMGGHQAGKMASTMVAEGLAGVAAKPDASDLVAACRDALIATNGHLRETAKVMGLNQAGATVVLLIIHSGRYFCLWCGDSRIYRIRSNAIAQLTRDHSEVQELIARGLLSAEEAKTWPRRNVITRAIGGAIDTVPEMIDGEIEVGDIFVLCSDGLTNHVSDGEIGETCASGDAQSAADQLIDLTLDRGAKDNVTAVVVHCQQREPTVVDLTGTPKTRLVLPT